jgi:PD-(D/E)XK nuclease superfamily
METITPQGEARTQRISRTKLQLFLDCARCFHLDVRSGCRRPDGLLLSLNLAVDALLKREFDAYRLHATTPPVCVRGGLDVVPLAHPDLERWRDFRTGIQGQAPGGTLQLYGALDDVWKHRTDGRVSVVDYKARSGSAATATLEGERYDGYRRQVEVYQWLLQQEGIDVHPSAYFLVASADAGAPSFDGRLLFHLSLVEHVGDTAWVPDALLAAEECLQHEQPPPSSNTCRWCAYRRSGRLREANEPH